MDICNSSIRNVKILKTRCFYDERGMFSEIFNAHDLSKAGINLDFVQDNFSISLKKGTVRGLHYQAAPAAQAKLVRVHRGAIFDVAVDIRVGSPTFGAHVSVILSADEWKQIFIPKGFAHGFCVLEPNTEVIYKVSDFYAPDLERGIVWNEPILDIPWPVHSDDILLSQKDRELPCLKDADLCFHYDKSVL